MEIKYKWQSVLQINLIRILKSRETKICISNFLNDYYVVILSVVYLFIQIPKIFLLYSSLKDHHIIDFLYHSGLSYYYPFYRKTIPEQPI